MKPSITCNSLFLEFLYDFFRHLALVSKGDFLTWYFLKFGVNIWNGIINQFATSGLRTTSGKLKSYFRNKIPAVCVLSQVKTPATDWKNWPQLSGRII